MPSPFPGMDPYLESPVYWQDFHSRFVNSLSEQIADALPGNYFARIEEEVVLLAPESISKRARADVLVGRDPMRAAATRPEDGGGGVAVETPAPATLHNLGQRHALPAVPIPLKTPDADVPMGIGQAFRVAHERGRYERMIEYDAAGPQPPLDEADRAWVAEVASKARS